MSIVPYDEALEVLLSSLDASSSRVAYKGSVTSFIRWYAENEYRDAYRALVAWKAYLRDDLGQAAATINSKLSAVRRYFGVAASLNLIDAKTATAIQSVTNVSSEGKRLATWLSLDEALELLSLPDLTSVIGRRDYALLSLLVGVGLRRSEVVGLTWGQFEKVTDNTDTIWIIRDLRRKRNRTQSLTVPDWIIEAVREYGEALPGYRKGYEDRVFASFVNGAWNDSITERAILDIVKSYGRLIDHPDLAPHDLRRTWAGLAYKGGADIVAIQETLGHESIETTRNYLKDLTVFENDSVYKTGLDNFR